MKQWIRKWLLGGLEDTFSRQVSELHAAIASSRELTRSAKVQSQIDISSLEKRFIESVARLHGVQSESQEAINRLLAWHQIARTPLWEAAENAVAQVWNNKALQDAATTESEISFCPRCGQVPDGDRRMEEARELVIAKGIIARRSDLDFAINAHFWMKKNAL